MMKVLINEPEKIGRIENLKTNERLDFSNSKTGELLFTLHIRSKKEIHILIHPGGLKKE